MPIYLYWGEDEFAIAKALQQLQQDVLDSNWIQFNYQKISGDQPDGIIEALNGAMTPAFGMGKRLVWLAETTICQSCSDEVLAELERTLPVIGANSFLLLTTAKKPDGRSKATKLLQKYAQIREFSLIPSWKSEELLQRVQQVSKEIGVHLTHDAATMLAESVGNDTRLLWNELEKLRLYAGTNQKPLDADTVSALVISNTQNSLQLAAAIRSADPVRALKLVTDLLNRNEPALKIVATLVGQFRTWATVKLMIESGERDEKTIAVAAEVGNPKRVYFLRKEVQSLSSKKLLALIPVLLDLEVSLKQGADPLSTLQTKVIELCRICR